MANLGLFLFFSSSFSFFLSCVFVCGRDCPFEIELGGEYIPTTPSSSFFHSEFLLAPPSDPTSSCPDGKYFLHISLTPISRTKKGATPKNNRNNKIMEPNDFVGISGVSSVLAARNIEFPLLFVNCFFFPLFFRGENNGPVVYTG